MAHEARIREARADDEDQISQLHARCIGDVFNGRYLPPQDRRTAAQLRWSGPVGAPLARHALLVADWPGGWSASRRSVRPATPARIRRRRASCA
jgi:hypothetical protein